MLHGINFLSYHGRGGVQGFARRMRLKHLKPLSFIPAVLVMCLIFRFSSQTGGASGSLSYTASLRLVEAWDAVSGKGCSENELHEYAHRIEQPIRKLAHVAEYFLLAVTVAFPLYLYELRGRRLVIVTVLFCAAFAAGDEYHQSFVAGRGPSARDVLIDSAGAAAGAAGMYLMAALVGKYRTGRKITH